MVLGELGHHPGDQLRQAGALDCPTGCADGRPPRPRPVLRTALVARTPQQPVRWADESPVAGLPRAVAPLALSQAPRRLPVPRPRLGVGPAVPRHPPQAPHLPPPPIPPPGFARLGLGALLPTQAPPSRRGAIGPPPLLPAGPRASVAPAARCGGRPGQRARHALPGGGPSVRDQGPGALPRPPYARLGRGMGWRPLARVP